MQKKKLDTRNYIDLYKNGTLSLNKALSAYIKNMITYHNSIINSGTKGEYWEDREMIKSLFGISNDQVFKNILYKNNIYTVSKKTKVHGHLLKKDVWVNGDNPSLIDYVLVDGKIREFTVKDKFNLHREELSILDFTCDYLFKQYAEG